MKCKENLKKKGNSDSVAAYKPQAWDYCWELLTPYALEPCLHHRFYSTPLPQWTLSSHPNHAPPNGVRITCTIPISSWTWVNTVAETDRHQVAEMHAAKKNSLDLEITGMSSLFIPLTLWFLRVELTMVIFFEWGQILWCFVCPT